MTQVKSNKPKVAVIGLGNIGNAVATNLVKGEPSGYRCRQKNRKGDSSSSKTGNAGTTYGDPGRYQEKQILLYLPFGLMRLKSC